MGIISHAHVCIYWWIIHSASRTINQWNSMMITKTTHSMSELMIELRTQIFDPVYREIIWRQHIVDEYYTKSIWFWSLSGHCIDLPCKHWQSWISDIFQSHRNCYHIAHLFVQACIVHAKLNVHEHRAGFPNLFDPQPPCLYTEDLATPSTYLYHDHDDYFEICLIFSGILWWFSLPLLKINVFVFLHLPQRPPF